MAYDCENIWRRQLYSGRTESRPRALFVIAGTIGQETALPSLEVCSETTIQQAAGGGFYSTTLSFRDAHTPLPMEFNPRKVFLQLFGEGDTDAERALISADGSMSTV